MKKRVEEEAMWKKKDASISLPPPPPQDQPDKDHLTILTHKPTSSPSTPPPMFPFVTWVTPPPLPFTCPHPLIPSHPVHQ